MVLGHTYATGESGLSQIRDKSSEIITKYVSKSTYRYKCQCGYSTNRGFNYNRHTKACIIGLKGCS